MKKLSLFVIVLFISMTTMAQVPNLINYQAVVRDAAGASVVSTSVGVKVSLLVASASGATAYSETHLAMTNQYGLINFKIGDGTVVSGDIASIAWGSNDFFLKVEVDPLGGAAYTISSTSQLVAVPYALHAATVEDSDDADADPTNEAISIYTLTVANELQITEGGTLWTVDLSGLVDDADADPANETITAVAIAGSTLTITEAGVDHDVVITGLGDDADADPDNEAQTISLAGTTVTLTDVAGAGGGAFSINDADFDPDNEAQTISLAGSTVTLTNVAGAGGGSFSINDADADATNEAQTISLAGSTVTLTDVSGSGGGSFSINDADADATNEAQTISLAGSTVTLTNVSGSGGGTFSIDDADADDSNELITAGALVGTDLEITEAGVTTTIDMSGLVAGGTRYYVGQKLFGGIIVFVDSSGLHGLVAANTDVGGAQFWDGLDGVTNEDNTGLPNYDATDENDGATQTGDIVTHWGTGTTYAARTAAEYAGGGFTDWYLPSIWELDLLMQQKFLLGFTTADLTKRYWSSTEPIAALGASSMVYRIDGCTIFAQSQITNGYVRPVRKF